MQAGNDLCGTRTKNSSNEFIQKWDKAGNKLLMALASKKNSGSGSYSRAEHLKGASLR